MPQQPWSLPHGGGSSTWTLSWDCGDAAALTPHDFTATEAATVAGVDVTGRYGLTRADVFELNASDGLRWELSSTGKWGFIYGTSVATSGQSAEAPRLEWSVSDAIGTVYDPTKHTVALQWRVTSDLYTTYEKQGGYIYRTPASQFTNAARLEQWGWEGNGVHARLTANDGGFTTVNALQSYAEMVVFPYGRVHTRLAAWSGSWPDPLTVTPTWKAGQNYQANAADEADVFQSTCKMGLFAARWTTAGSFYATVPGWRVLWR